MQHILANIVSLACVIAAAVLAYLDKDAWGWFLVVGAMLYVGPLAYSKVRKD